MEPILSSIIGALAAGALAKAGEVGGRVVLDAYEGLKTLIIQKLGKKGAVEGVEEDPQSEAAQASLAEALTKGDKAADQELAAHAEALKAVLDAVPAEDRSGIEVGDITGKVNVLVQRLATSGKIKLGNLKAETGDAVLTDLTAGVPSPKKA